MSKPFAIVIHGGAGTVLPDVLEGPLETTYREALHAAATIGRGVLVSGGSAIEAVEAAVKQLEDCPFFNAGKGAVFNADGQHEMDASIMDGTSLNAGAIAGVQNVKNPISLARRVMENSAHVMLSGWGAFEFAHKQKVELEEDKYFHDDFRYDQWKRNQGTDNYQLDHSASDKKYGTVGAVALDKNGDLAAATSTGGMTNKRYNRIGDSPIIGAGNYANNASCAVSCTGHGEAFIKAVAAHEVHALMIHKGWTLAEAAAHVIQEQLPKLQGDGGLIAVDRAGNIALEFNCSAMYRAYAVGMEDVQTGIFK